MRVELPSCAHDIAQPLALNFPVLAFSLFFSFSFLPLLAFCLCFRASVSDILVASFSVSMRIRKRQSRDEVLAPTLPIISCKYQQEDGDGGEQAQQSAWELHSSTRHQAHVLGNSSGAVGKPDMQWGADEVVVTARGRGVADQVQAVVVGMEQVKLKQSDANGENYSEGGGLPDLTDSHRTSKRRKVEQESSPVFEGSSAMTDAELLVVNELAFAVRQRLDAASRTSTSEQATKYEKPVENPKDALISSIFFVFDTCGENGLSASEVVKIMLDQGLPGLKEGGARHTVQVANVLRSSSSFVSLGDKRYLLCSNLEIGFNSKKQISRPPQQSFSSGATNPGKDSEKAESLNHGKQGRGLPKASNSLTETYSGYTENVSQAEDPDLKKYPQPESVNNGEGEVVVKVRRRGPLSSQKGKGSTQCKRYDGRGWRCSRLTEPGYSLCVHHQDLINKRAAKLKEAQSKSRILQEPTPVPRIKVKTTASSSTCSSARGEVNFRVKLVSRPTSSGSDSIPGAPLQKRKMLSLQALK